MQGRVRERGRCRCHCFEWSLRASAGGQRQIDLFGDDGSGRHGLLVEATPKRGLTRYAYSQVQSSRWCSTGSKQARIAGYLSFEEGWKDDHEEAKFPQIKGGAANSSSAQQRGCRDVLWEILFAGVNINNLRSAAKTVVRR